ncbi:uncharacterized protein LOC116213666 [Punica granatum]|uniref:Transmembrane protein n=2 Tax=Punica granatum TaxID=22663 RepID=A0A218XLN4_PUNGR|nr:uncharacterized protein LOC116213666 [Punica granatum]OWM85804.1 hypothetical protein CDL15_Pgr012054 [Punica granatum]PKI77517.1 hypothetical protein CRG98_002123 [Punica granatum]
MAIPAAILKYRLHILVAVILSLSLLGLVLLAPRFVTLLAYFWPLFLSTALFLVAVVFFGKTSPPTPDKAGEGLLDYVAGDPDPVVAEPIVHNLKPDDLGQHQQDEAAAVPAEDNY